MNTELQRMRWQLRHSRWRRWTAWVMLVLGGASAIDLVVRLATGTGDEPAATLVLRLLAAIFFLLVGGLSVRLSYGEGPEADQLPPPMPTVKPEYERAFQARVIAMSCVIVTAGLVTVIVGAVIAAPLAILVRVVLTVVGVAVPPRLYRLFLNRTTSV